ncbi:glycoside hydrolase family 3 protein [uncultured Ornithinimicrobium sp.]|uniref:glycoside hydrolase family 3 protein n=1 Tax=uncultured Ornithinimicrobium sp. TaxID=259307 RepID=UPI00259A1ED6|nr:glycoside hydrolase family 3 N-terminal domain-containing protein [uncultured Ornithinimicrobium sp.]
MRGVARSGVVGAVVLLVPLGACAVKTPAPTSSPAGSTTTVEPAPETTATPAPAPAPDPEPSDEADRTTEPPEPEPALEDEAAELVKDLTLEEKAGQVVVAAHLGTTPPVGLVTDHHLGGIIVMDPDLTTDQLAGLNAAMTEAGETTGRAWPVFLGVDQEGGLVERAKGDLTRFPTFMSLGAADDPDLTRRAAAASGAELRGAGFTAVFAPTADVTMGPSDPTIGSRSPGGDPELVAEHATAAGLGYLDAGILPVVKHFPGHGSVPADSHVQLPVQTRTLEELRDSDLVPFEAAVEADLPAVMVGHIQVAALESQLPSSLEPEVVEGLLRGDLGFDGLVVTDALNMAAVSNAYGPGQASVAALQAGADVLLMPSDPLAARDAIVAAVGDGTLAQERLDEAVVRQVTALLEAQEQGTAEPLEPGGAANLAREVSQAAVTLVQGECGGPLVDGGVVPLGDRLAVQRFERAAERAGLPLGTGTTVELLRPGQGPYGAQVSVALETPYLLAASGAPRKVALYGDTPGAMDALVAVLTGDAPAPGQLPVEVDGLERAGC